MADPNDYIPAAFGPGSQVETPDGDEGKKLEYMEMPREMATFEFPIAPEPEDTEGMKAGKAKLMEVIDVIRQYKVGEPAKVVDTSELTELDLGLVNQLLGEGEVSMVSGSSIQVQESYFAGVWRVLHFGGDGKLVKDTIEIASWPDAVAERVFVGAQDNVPLADMDNLPAGVFNTPALLSELSDKVKIRKPGDPVHSINLSLLPHTEEDLVYLNDMLGKGDTIILSRGYGNCRVSSTKTENVWWVQYYNSQDALILNTLEIIDIPEVVCAAQEDIEDSAERLEEIMELYQ
ncbi:MAG: hydrogenase expression/formation protein [Hyphomicrobiaceae bacterium]|nr:hydrogenase expression/formation protein [Hyphomicrobiaceae bacterium]